MIDDLLFDLYLGIVLLLDRSLLAGDVVLVSTYEFSV